MSATIAYYKHMIDLYNSRSRTIAWDDRLENYRRWYRCKKDFSWPTAVGTFS